jgi:hypothetical protein
VAASGEGGTPATDDPAVNAILAALTLADHPGDSIAAFHVLGSPLSPIVGLTSLVPAQVRAVAANIRHDFLIDGYGSVVTRWARALAASCNLRGVQRLTQLIELADAYDGDATLRPGDFVRLVATTPVEEPSPAAVRVMTVHKAKGLEFDMVVLPQLERPMAQVRDAAVYVMRNAPTGPIAAVFRAADKTVRDLSPQLTAAYQQEVTRRLQDDLCALYVAMTRPRHALHLIVKPLKSKKDGTPGSKGLSNASPAAVLRQALRPAGFQESFAGGQTLYAHGDPDWNIPSEPGALATGVVRSSSGVAPNLPARAQTPARVNESTNQRINDATSLRSWRQVTPSSLESAGIVHAADLLTIDPSPAALRGSILHAWFALIEFSDAPRPQITQIHKNEPGSPNLNNASPSHDQHPTPDAAIEGGTHIPNNKEGNKCTLNTPEPRQSAQTAEFAGAAMPDNALLRTAALCELAGLPALPPDNLELFLTGLMDDFQAMLRTPEIHRALARPSITPVPGIGAREFELWRERPFAVRLDNQLLSGRFDRVVVYRSVGPGLPGQALGAEILDFKTDRIAPDKSNLPERIERYRPQLHAYRRALAAMLGLDPARITAQLLFVDSGDLCTVP